MATVADTRPARINIRATQHQKDVVARAARLTHTTISEFVLGRAYKDAREVLAEQNEFRLPTKQWRAFCRALDAPPKDITSLRTLLSERGVFDG